MLTGAVRTGVLNPVPDAEIAEIFAVVPPVFVIATLCVAVVPVFTLPKSSDATEAARFAPVANGTAPVPSMPTTVGEFVALLRNETVPFTAPRTVGANVTVTA